MICHFDAPDPVQGEAQHPTSAASRSACSNSSKHHLPFHCRDAFTISYSLYALYQHKPTCSIWQRLGNASAKYRKMDIQPLWPLWPHFKHHILGVRRLGIAMPLLFALWEAALFRAKICIKDIHIPLCAAIRLTHNVDLVCSKTFAAPNAQQFFICSTCFAHLPACVAGKLLKQARGRVENCRKWASCALRTRTSFPYRHSGGQSETLNWNPQKLRCA